MAEVTLAGLEKLLLEARDERREMREMMHAFQREQADIRRLVPQGSAALVRFERRMVELERRFLNLEQRLSDLKPDLELMFKVELMGQAGHLETRLESRLGRLETRIETLEGH